MKKNFLISTCLVLMFISKNFSQSFYGITLCGGEFGESNLPGVYGLHYIYPSSADIDYFSSKGVTLIQLPVKWERLQHNPGDNLDTAEVNKLLNVLTKCSEKNLKVIMILQNFGRYYYKGKTHIVGDVVFNKEVFKDFWMKMTIAFGYEYSLCGFDIMAEPHDMIVNTWPSIAQSAVDGIRMANRNLNIYIEGENYSNPYTWEKYNDNLKYINDPYDKIYYNVHCYFDYDYSGKYTKSFEQDGADEWTGVKRMSGFAEWLVKNGKRGYVGEFGVPKNNAKWLVVLNNFIHFLIQNQIGGSYWAAGQWWGNYPLSIQPVNGQDQPQMKVLTQLFLPTLVSNNTPRFQFIHK